MGHGRAERAQPVECPEIVEITRRFYRSFFDRDPELLANMFSTDGSVLAIGSDPDEWWPGHRLIAEVYRAQFSEMDYCEFQEIELRGWQLGDVGWCADRPLVTVNDVTVQFRVTMVFRLELGHWKCVQCHFSIGASNEAVLGTPLTTSIAGLADTVQEEQPDLDRAAAPDGTVTILFSDIEGSTTLNERLGDMRFLELLDWHDSLLREAAVAHDGYVVKSQGDGFMVAFPSASRAVDFGAGVQRELEVGWHDVPVRVRMGLHTGEVTRKADDYYGRAVTLAARVAAQAFGSEILVSDVVREILRSRGYEFGESRTARLKGLEGEHRMWPLAWEKAGAVG